MNVLNHSKEDTSKVNTLNQLSLCISYSSRDKALQYANDALKLATQLNYKSGEASSYYNIGGLTGFRFGKTEEAIQFYKTAIRLRMENKEEFKTVILYNDLGILYDQLSNYPEALKCQFLAVRIAGKYSDRSGMAGSYKRIGNINVNMSKHSETFKYWSMALNIYEELKDTVNMAGTYKDLGMIHIEQGNLAESLKYLLLGLRIYEAKNWIPQIAASLKDIGSVYNNLGNYSEALKYQRTALKKAEECGSKRLLMEINLEFGKVYYNKGEYGESLKYHYSALNIFNLNFDPKSASWFLADIKHHIGRVYIAQAEILTKQKGSRDSITSKLDEAVSILNESKTLFEFDSTRDGMAETYTDLGIVISRKAAFLDSAKAIEKYKEAIDHLNDALSLAKEIGLKKIIKEAYAGLAETYQKMGEYKKALDNTVYYSAMKDTLYSNESLNKIGELRISFETEKAQAAEKSRQEKVQAEMQFAFSKREDSLKYQQSLTQASLDLSNKQNDINKLAYLNSQAELEAEQSRRKDKEQQLKISEQEKTLQSNELALQQTQLNLKESQIQVERKQRLFYAGGIALLVLLFVFVYRNIINRQKTEKFIATERLRSEKVSAAHKMAELELQSLRAQLNPHFMFNSLNAIQELILKEDNDNSHLYLSRFSELLRMLLDNANQPFVPLRKEISLLEHYLSLENLRIPDLKYSIEIDPEIDSNRITIPNMMLQPYIENAIWHGLSHKKGERNLKIRITKKQDNIICEVEDNGVGRKMATELKSLYRKEHRSRGMELLSKRFSLLSKEYGSDIQTGIEDLHDNGTATGTRITIIVPSSLTEQFKTVYS